MTSTKESFLQDLCNLEIPTTIKFSPDGQQVLYSTELTWGHYNGKHPVSTLWLASTGQQLSSRKLTSGLFKDYSPSWSPDGQSIAFVSDRAKIGKKWAIYIMPLMVGSAVEAYPITPLGNERAIEAYKFSPNGKSIAYLSANEKTVQQKSREINGEDVNVWGEQLPYARLRVVDLQTKQVRSLQLDRHTSELCWSPDGKQIGLKSLRTPDTEEPYLTGSLISVLDSELLTVTNLLNFPKNIWDLQWATSERLCFCGPTPADRISVGTCVYSVDVNSEAPTFQRIAFGTENDASSLTRAKATIIAKVEHRLESRICLLDGQALYCEEEELGAFDVTFMPDSSEVVLALATSNINKPVEVYTKAANSIMVQLSNHGSSFKDHDFGACNFLRCQSTDGQVELDSCYLTPASRVTGEAITTSRKPLPTVVLIHGGPTTRLTNAFNSYYYMLAPYLLSIGYGILLPNYRGSSGRGERFASYTVGGTGQYDYADVIALTQNTIEKGYADKQRLFVAGWSTGGLLTLLCSVRNGSHGFGWKFNASSPGAAPSDLDTMTMTSDLGSSAQAEFNYDRTPWNTDQSEPRNHSGSALREFSAAVKRSKETGTVVVPPMLILHGEEDVRVPVSQAWGVRRALQSEGLPFELVTYPRQGHFFAEQKFWIDMAMRIGRWCDKYIGPRELRDL
ncbi:putative acylamino-acid-releasing enzyme [Hyaloscypha hepaticicola]|uniref:Dipeptidyl-peptidase V n=1 Tax=Hyaloscypha hepaticicola TaxID=2082293 RepID=A0A2J6PVQ5_9HELO|nr:putative acylamino-acid-releasing enzyme [Hyaloscypha hepaticicola]